MRRRAELVLVSVTPSAPPPTVVTIAEAIAAPIIVAVAETEATYPTTIFPPALPKLDILRGKGGSPFQRCAADRRRLRAPNEPECKATSGTRSQNKFSHEIDLRRVVLPDQATLMARTLFLARIKEAALLQSLRSGQGSWRKPALSQRRHSFEGLNQSIKVSAH